MDALTKVYKINKLKSKIKSLEKEIDNFSLDVADQNGFLKSFFGIRKAKKLSKKYEKAIKKLGNLFVK